MNRTAIIAIAVVAVLAVGGGATAFILLNDDEGATYNDGAYNIIARVNSEGSGIYIKASMITDSNGDGIPERNDTPFYNIVDGKYVVDESNKAAWAGLKLGTPGATSIQHIQICQLASQMGLNMVNVASTSSSNASESIYFNATITNYQSAVDINNDIDGGIVWEPQYARIVGTVETPVDRDFTKLALTNDLFSGHTCCTVIGSHKYIESHEDITVRYLAGYVDAVKFMQEALKVDSSNNRVNTADYNELVNICKKYTTGLESDIIEDALETITYLYADGADGSLDKLTKDIEALATDLKNLGSTTRDTTPSELAEALVDDSYLKQAVNYEYKGTAKDKVKVAVIDGDIHQIAIRVAVEKGYFDAYGIEVEVSTGLANGGAVADAVIGNQANFGFIGAPPATLKTINAPLISV